MLDRIRPTAIVHLAGIASQTHTQIGEMYAANVVGTANLFAALVGIKLEPRIIIVASSGQLYASPDAEVLLTEEHRWRPRPTMPLANTRLKKLLRSIRASSRLSSPVRSTIPVQVKRRRSSFPRSSGITLSNGAKLSRKLKFVPRLFRHRSCHRAYSRLVSQPIAPTTVNICSGRAVYLADILAIMDDISGHPLRRVSDPSLFRADEARFLVGSPARLEGLIVPLPNPELRDTLARMYDAFVKQHVALG